jgi:hypothetical protein
MHFDIRVAFVIFQADIEARPVLLDQIHFQDQRFQFGAHHDPFDIGDIAHQAPGLLAGIPIGMEIRAHAGAQIDCFPHVDDLPAGILHQVAAGFGGKRAQNALEVF